MIFKPKLTTVVTALVLFGGAQTGRAEYTLDQLIVIDRHISSGDCGGLLGYLSDNPDIMSGGDALAQELRSFVDGVNGGLVECLSAPPTRGTGGGSTIAEIY